MEPVSLIVRCIIKCDPLHSVQNYTLVEYRDCASVDDVLANSKQFPNGDHIPVQSRLLYYHPSRDRLDGASRRGFPVSHRESVDNYRLNVLTELDLQKCSSVCLLIVIVIVIIVIIVIIIVHWPALHSDYRL